MYIYLTRYSRHSPPPPPPPPPPPLPAAQPPPPLRPLTTKPSASRRPTATKTSARSVCPSAPPGPQRTSLRNATTACSLKSTIWSPYVRRMVAIIARVLRSMRFVVALEIFIRALHVNWMLEERRGKEKEERKRERKGTGVHQEGKSIVCVVVGGDAMAQNSYL